MVVSFGLVGIISAFLCFLSKCYLKNDGDSPLILALLQLQGWLGMSICLWGLWALVYAHLDLRTLTVDWFYWINILLGAFLSIFSGGLLGFGMVQKLTIDELTEAAQAAAIKLRFRLVLLQINTSYVAGSLGIWLVVFFLLAK